MLHITKKQKNIYLLWWINVELGENGTPEIGKIFCTCCTMPYQFFYGGIYPLFLTETLQGINIENQPITYFLYQIILMIFIILKGEMQDDF